jgi:hypothetical protein
MAIAMLRKTVGLCICLLLWLVVGGHPIGLDEVGIARIDNN